MNILIKNRQEITTINPTASYIVISVTEPTSKTWCKTVAVHPHIPENEHCKGILKFLFADTDDKDDPECIQEHHAILFWNFVQQHSDAYFIYCQCDGGICRSSAMAAAILNANREDNSWVFDTKVPNMLVYRTLLNEANERGMI